MVQNVYRLVQAMNANVKTVGGDENSNFLGSSPFKPLKINILPQNFIWLYRVHSKVNVKKKWGRYVDLSP